MITMFARFTSACVSYGVIVDFRFETREEVEKFRRLNPNIPLEDANPVRQ